MPQKERETYNYIENNDFNCPQCHREGKILFTKAGMFTDRVAMACDKCKKMWEFLT